MPNYDEYSDIYPEAILPLSHETVSLVQNCIEDNHFLSKDDNLFINTLRFQHPAINRFMDESVIGLNLSDLETDYFKQGFALSAFALSMEEYNSGKIILKHFDMTAAKSLRKNIIGPYANDPEDSTHFQDEIDEFFKSIVASGIRGKTDIGRIWIRYLAYDQLGDSDARFAFLFGSGLMLMTYMDQLMHPKNIEYGQAYLQGYIGKIITRYTNNCN